MEKVNPQVGVASVYLFVALVAGAAGATGAFLEFIGKPAVYLVLGSRAGTGGTSIGNCK